jgi:hypothetical protein
MKYIISLILLMSFSANGITAPGGGHHKLVEYDYHDYINSNIQSKTFVRYQNGVVYDFVWAFDRSNPAMVVRTEIATDASSNITRYTESVFTAAAESFDLLQSRRYDPGTTPPALVDTSDYTPPVAKLTHAMIPGIAWGPAGKINSTYSGESYYSEKSELIAVEDVTVPAGTFNSCLKIHRTSQYGGSLYTRMDWVCPDLGIVKRINNGAVLIELASVTYN